MKSIKMFISAVLAAVMFSACATGNGSSLIQPTWLNQNLVNPISI